MLPPPVLNALFCEQMRQARISLSAVSVMGLYDGYGVDPYHCSTAAHTANSLAARSSHHCGSARLFQRRFATVMGFQHFTYLNLAGVRL